MPPHNLEGNPHMRRHIARALLLAVCALTAAGAMAPVAGAAAPEDTGSTAAGAPRAAYKCDAVGELQIVGIEWIASNCSPRPSTVTIEDFTMQDASKTVHCKYGLANTEDGAIAGSGCKVDPAGN
jgi:hypothetical protein